MNFRHACTLLVYIFAGALMATTAMAATSAAKPAKTMQHAPAEPGAAATRAPIHAAIVLPASPDRVYEALLDSTTFAAVTHFPASIDRAEGGAFRTFGGMIEGRNVELVPGVRIVQAWRPRHWPAGVFSVVRFELTPEGAGTRLTLTHSNYEEGEPRADLVKGWNEHYFAPLKAYFAATK